MFGDKLRIARKSKGLTLEQLAFMYNKKFDGGLSKGTLSKYENNKQEPMITVVGNLATVLGVSVDYLIDDKIQIKKTEYDSFEQYDNIKTITTKRFPVLGEIACGQPIYANQDYETYVEASNDIDADFCLTAKGDSMINARIFDGDIVFIKRQPDVDNGEIAAVIIGDEATLKRVYKYQTRIELRPENPTYPVLNYEGEDLNNIMILGKAVAFQSYVR